MRYALLAFLSISLIGFALSAQENVIVVEVTGESSGGTDVSPQKVMQLAREDAKRKALERAGVYMESESKTEMAMITKDEVQSWAQGFVKVLEEQEPEMGFDPKLKATHCKIQIKAEVHTRDMSELLERAKKERMAQAAVAQPLSFEYSFLAQRQLAGGDWGEVRVKDGSTLRSGDQFQISIRADRDCHAYVINQDASGAVYVLFPHEQAISNRLTGGREYALPDRDLFYQLDDVVGLETFYLAVSPTPMADLEWIIGRIEKLGSDAGGMIAMLDGALKSRGGRTRGAGKVVPGRKKTAKLTSGKAEEQVTEMIKGKGALVRVITLDHR